jgi:dihydroceramidase
MSDLNLLDPMQLVDELSMIYTTCIMVFATFGHRKSTTYQWGLTIGLIALSAFITLYYHYLQEPTFHQVTYALLTTMILVRAVYVMEVNIRPSLKQKQREIDTDGYTNGRVSPMQKKAHKREDARDAIIVRKMWSLIAVGLSIFLGGFAIWNLDNIYCSKLRSWRHEVGLPWGIFLEGHGWWHLMTGTGAYFYIVWGTWLRHCLNGKQDEYKLVWPRWWSIPEVVTVENPENGSAKKAI